MDPGRPLDIRQGATAVIIVGENASAPRYLYTNRAAHISEDILDPSTNGDSIARWQGDTLVVDTIGFHGQRGITAILGGDAIDKKDVARLESIGSDLDGVCESCHLAFWYPQPRAR